MHSCCEDWTERHSIGSLIKETCFDSSRPNAIDPSSYTKDIVVTARNFHPRFASIDDSCWCIAFRRAASELTLERDLGLVEDLYRVCRVAPTNQPNTVPLTATKSNKKHPVNPELGSTFKLRRTITMTEGAKAKKTMDIKLCLPNIVSTWKDQRQNERAHVIFAMPSGVSPKGNDVVNAELISGRKLVIGIKWPSDMFDVDRIFGHPRFHNQNGPQYDATHPKCIALQSAMDEIRGANGIFKSKLTIDLPGSNYEFTDNNISGHNSISFIEDFVVDDDGNQVAPKTTIFVLIDLMVKPKNNGLKFSTKAECDDDLMVG